MAENLTPKEIGTRLHAELDKYADEINSIYFGVQRSTSYFNLAQAGKMEVALKAIAYFRSVIDEVTQKAINDIGEPHEP